MDTYVAQGQSLALLHQGPRAKAVPGATWRGRFHSLTKKACLKHLEQNGIRFDNNAALVMSALPDFDLMPGNGLFAFSEVRTRFAMPLTENLNASLRCAWNHGLLGILPPWVAPLLWGATEWLFTGKGGLVVIMHVPVEIAGSKHMLAIWRTEKGSDQLTTVAMDAAGSHAGVTRVFYNPNFDVTPLPVRS